MHLRSWLSTASLVSAVLLAAPAVHAQDEYFFGWTQGAPATQLITDQGTFNHLDRGWVRGSGSHQASNDNYFTGSNAQFADFYRSFFLFDLANLSGSVTSATFRAWNNGSAGQEGYLSADPTETFILSFVNPMWYDDMLSIMQQTRPSLPACLAVGKLDLAWCPRPITAPSSR
jgi:hypothetical protein